MAWNPDLPSEDYYGMGEGPSDNTSWRPNTQQAGKQRRHFKPSTASTDYLKLSCKQTS